MQADGIKLFRGPHGVWIIGAKP